MSDIIVGQPLPWNVHDSAGHLLLHRGYIVESAHQLQGLVDRGLYIDAAHLVQRESAPVQHEAPSVLRLINLANIKLERLLFGLFEKEAYEPDVPARTLEIAQVVRSATELNSDVAVACILLNQEAGKYPVRHCIDTAIVSFLIARSMSKSPEEILPIIAAALTMNVGMVAHHERLQSKQGEASAEDWRIIKAHPQASVDLLQLAGVADEEWLSCVLCHHENADGSGYPFGKVATEIPQNAKLISLADRYCARVSGRDYRKPVLPNIALREIFLENGKISDQPLAVHFIKELGIYPPGTFVRLHNEEIAVVTHKGESATTPIVYSIIGHLGTPLTVPIKREPSTEGYAIREAVSAKQVALRLNMQQLWGDVASL
jgi:HD-GYP domain-containing protein (c-di-GMP phosphodiesterase class II)